MRKRSALVLAAVGVVGCFEQTDPFDLAQSGLELSIDVGTFDGACDTPSGTTRYVKDGADCHVIIDKPSVSFLDMAYVRGLVAAHADLGAVDVSFHGPTADDMTLVIDRAGITGAPSAPVSRWTAQVSASGAALADVARSGVSTDALIPGPLAIDLPGTVIDALDDAWNREAAVPASIHIELWVPLDSAPALGAAGPLAVGFSLSLVGTGRTTTHGWP